MSIWIVFFSFSLKKYVFASMLGRIDGNKAKYIKTNRFQPFWIDIFEIQHNFTNHNCFLAILDRFDRTET